MLIILFIKILVYKVINVNKAFNISIFIKIKQNRFIKTFIIEKFFIIFIDL